MDGTTATATPEPFALTRRSPTGGTPALDRWGCRNETDVLIDVPFPDTVTLGCNVMSLGRDRVLAPRHSRTLIDALKAEGFEVAALDTAEISKTGGGIHCMAQALRRVPG